MSGKPGMFQSHSLTGAIRPAQVGAGQLGPKPKEAGSESTAPESLIWRQVVALYGGMYDPKTGEFIITDPAARPRAQQLAANAARLLKDSNGGLTPSEAVERARTDQTQIQPPPAATAQPPAASAADKFRVGEWA